jgi:hypothetical protein
VGRLKAPLKDSERGRVFYDTDPTRFKLPFWFFDYLSPGDWVHGDLEQVDSGAALLDRDRSDPDAIMTGWTVGMLWAIWVIFFLGSLLVSAVSCRTRWFP